MTAAASLGLLWIFPQLLGPSGGAGKALPTRGKHLKYNVPALFEIGSHLLRL
jgi:hypothetical protein